MTTGNSVVCGVDSALMYQLKTGEISFICRVKTLYGFNSEYPRRVRFGGAAEKCESCEKKCVDQCTSLHAATTSRFRSAGC